MIRIALIGCNNATADYGQVASRLQGAMLVAVVDPDSTVARHTAEALALPGKPRPICAASLDKLLRDNADALDAVVVRWTDSPAPSVIEQAAAAGKHVLLDMPLLLMAPPDAPIDTCSSAGVTLMVGQVTRFLPSISTVEGCLRSGVLGAPGLLRIHDWKPADVDGQARVGPNQTGVSAPIFQNVLRDIDLANWIFEALPTEVYAAGHGGPDVAAGQRPSTECGYLQIHLGYPDGGMALVDHCPMLPSGADYFSLSLIGSAGAAYADDHRNVHLLYGGGKPTALPSDKGKLHHVAQLQEFVRAIETGRRPAITADDGQKAVEVIRAADRSLKSGRAVQLVGSHYEFV